MKNKPPSILSMGLSSIITTFLLLLLAVFSSLSLITARGEYLLTQKTAHRADQVFLSQNEGEKLLKEIDTLLLKSYNKLKMPTYEDYGAAIDASLKSLPFCRLTEEDGVLAITGSIPVNESQSLQISVSPTFPLKKGEPYYTIQNWSIETTKTWEIDDSLDLYNPTDPPTEEENL